MSMFEPPYGVILDQLMNRKVIPFLGAGASLTDDPASDVKWKKERAGYMPSSDELAHHLVQKTSFPDNEKTDLPKVAQYYQVMNGREPLEQELHGIFDHDYPYTSLHTFLAELNVPLIITTNYDDLIERAFDAKGCRYEVVIYTTDPTIGDKLYWRPYGEIMPREVISNKLYIDLNAVTVIYKMHGAVDRNDAKRDQYVITEDDYIDFLVRLAKNKAIPSIFFDSFQSRHFLFLGYSLQDWNLRVVLNRIEKDRHRPKSIVSWAIQHNPSRLEQQFWQKREVQIFDLKINDFVEKLKRAK
jgi:SIR2-like domain